MIKAVLCVGVLVGVAALVWSSRQQSAEPRTANSALEAPAIVDQPAVAQPVLDEPLDAVHSDDRKVQPASEPAPTIETVQSAPPVDFKAKYAGKTRAELLTCLSQVRDSRLQLQKQITTERAANGQFLRHDYTPGVEFSPSQIAKAEVDRLYPQSDQPVAFQMRGGGGKNYVEVTGIPRGEYPAFEDLQREEIWLNQTIGN